MTLRNLIKTASRHVEPYARQIIERPFVAHRVLALNQYLEGFVAPAVQPPPPAEATPVPPPQSGQLTPADYEVILHPLPDEASGLKRWR
jgi:hypothetical protein